MEPNLTPGNWVYELRQELLAKLPSYGLVSGATALFFVAFLYLYSVPPQRARKKLAPSVYQKICSTGADGVQSELLVSSRQRLVSGRYLVRCCDAGWQWADIVMTDGDWHHEILPNKEKRENIWEGVAIVVLLVAIVVTLALITLSHFA